MEKKKKKKASQRKKSVQENCSSESNISNVMVVIDINTYLASRTPCFLLIKDEDND